MISDLEQAKFFYDLSPKQLEEIAPFCKLLQLSDGEIMIQEGGTGGNDLFYLLSGSVEIVSNNTSILSNEVVLSKEDKELFGEISWLTNCKRTASVRCRGPVEVIRIEETDDLMKQILWNTGL